MAKAAPEASKMAEPAIAEVSSLIVNVSKIKSAVTFNSPRVRTTGPVLTAVALSLRVTYLCLDKNKAILYKTPQ